MFAGFLIIIGFLAWFLIMRAIYRELVDRANGGIGSNNHLRLWLNKNPGKEIDDYISVYQSRL